MAGKGSSSQRQSIGLALGRLRIAVSVCCWIVGIALVLQLVVWSLTAYTDMRFETVQDTVATEPQVVVAESPRQHRIRQTREAEMGIDLGPEKPREVQPLRIFSRHDSIFASMYNLSAGFGRCAMLALIPLMMVGVMLAAGSATPGVDRVVSALVWAMVAAVLILPLGQAFTLPWDTGALSHYDQMTQVVDQVAQASAGETDSDTATSQQQHASSLVMHCRYGLLPLACLVGLALVGLRFCSGVEAGIIAGESMRLDPMLEREAANISPSSLHAGRATGALSQTMQSEADRSIPTAKAVSPGQSPGRLI